uniref:NADH-ubiquinone oxidoreductase chain 2 n=1 Tax=Phyllotreta variipennis TaxID=1425530 RepID=A0A3G1GNV1_9CUCU|nr:NADH dehydrogenase subunit 2 [Phyllotreta variipennis]
MLFFNLIFIGILISVSAYSWLGMWIGLEINLLSIIPLFQSNKNIYPAEACLKYFITQAMASIILLFAIIYSFNFINLMNLSMNLLNLSLLIKLGAAPFHFWFPEVSVGLNWFNNFILMTVQKMAPMILLMYNIMPSKLIFFSIICSSIIGSIYGLNQINLRKILAYSSINHLAWLLSSMIENKIIWFNYFLIYSLILMNIIYLFQYFKLYFLNQFIFINNQNKIIKLIFSLNFFSLGGLPPFIGFMPKWLTLNFLMNKNLFLISMILILFTLITLYFYTRMIFTNLTFNLTENLMLISQNKLNYFFISINVINLMLLIICLSFFNFN